MRCTSSGTTAACLTFLPVEHRLLIHGLVDRPLTFDLASLSRYPLVSRIHFIECSGNSAGLYAVDPPQGGAGALHGLLSCSDWTGVPLATLLDEVGVRPAGKWLLAEGADAAAMSRSIPIEKAWDDALIAIYQNGERLRPENGYPMRLLLPGWEGNTNVKWLRRLKVTAGPMMTKDETSKYTDLMPNGQARQFTFPMGVKSVITSPCGGQTMQGPGLYQISGSGVDRRRPHSPRRGLRRRRQDLGAVGLVGSRSAEGADAISNGVEVGWRSGGADEPSS